MLRAAIAFCLTLLCIVFPAVGQTVADNTSLANALKNAMPGSVIKLQSGTYRGGVFADLQGTKDKPIVIEAAGKEKPIIEGGTSGLQISKAKYVTVRNLRLRGAAGNGINIDDGKTVDHSSVGVVLEGLEVEDVGPVGNCDGIKLSGLKEFVVRDCIVTGWGGNGIDLVGCRDGVIERCTLTGKEGFNPATGPQIKGGSSNVIIRNCRFDRAGQRAVNIGGSTGLEFFRPLDAPFEAKDITVENNVFMGSEAAAAFVGVDGAVFRHNTIIDPGKWVFRILQESRDARFTRCRNVNVERNLIVYRRAAVRTAVNIGPETLPATFAFKENWWWCSDSPTTRPDLPTEEQRGVFGQDPKLSSDADWPTPQNAIAKSHGAKGTK